MNDLQPAMQGAAFAPVVRRAGRSTGQVVQRTAGTTRPNGMRIDAVGLSRHYGERTVLAGIDLRIAPGEFVAVVGRSGCGKSTLLRLLAGLESPDAGVLAFDGEALAGRSDATRMMFQDARLLPWKRVVDNVALGLGADIASAASRERALAALAEVGMASRALDWPSVLSGGQRQRVALARALVHTPRLLLLDEPLGALDALTRIEMHRLIESLWQRDGFTALLVTHDVTEAVALADRVILIENHAVSLDERVSLARPRERRAAFDEIEARILRRVLQAPPLDTAAAQDAAPATATATATQPAG